MSSVHDNSVNMKPPTSPVQQFYRRPLPRECISFCSDEGRSDSDSDCSSLTAEWPAARLPQSFFFFDFFKRPLRAEFQLRKDRTCRNTWWNRVLLIIEIHKIHMTESKSTKSTIKVRNPQKLSILIIEIHEIHMIKNRNPQNPHNHYIAYVARQVVNVIMDDLTMF